MPVRELDWDGPQGRNDLHCPGYVLRTNSSGFQWKQVCSCCDLPHSRYEYIDYDGCGRKM
jgi:hypothetical protein